VQLVLLISFYTGVAVLGFGSYCYFRRSKLAPAQPATDADPAVTEALRLVDAGPTWRAPSSPRQDGPTSWGVE
jgi:hypothetical protein